MGRSLSGKSVGRGRSRWAAALAAGAVVATTLGFGASPLAAKTVHSFTGTQSSTGIQEQVGDIFQKMSGRGPSGRDDCSSILPFARFDVLPERDSRFGLPEVAIDIQPGIDMFDIGPDLELWPLLFLMPPYIDLIDIGPDFELLQLDLSMPEVSPVAGVGGLLGKVLPGNGGGAC